MMNAVLRRLAANLEKKLNPTSIAQAFAALPPVEPRTQPAGDRPVAAALQYTARCYRDAADYIRDVDGYLGACAAQNAALVCFPELMGLLPLTMLPLGRMALRTAAKLPPARPDDSPKGEPAGDPLLLTALRHFAVLYDSHRDLFARFAARYGVWLSAGTVYVAEDGAVYNRHLLFGPDGALLGAGDKINLVLEELRMGMAEGQTLTVVPTAIGNIALTVCMDATYFETFRAAKSLGADYALVPIGNIEPFNHWLALRGAQSRVAETGLAAIKAALVADTPAAAALPKRLRVPLELTGRAGIYFPPESGLASVEYDPADPTPAVCAALDLAQLRRFRSAFFCLENSAFNARYLAAVTGGDHPSGSSQV